jgi:hypothetical protein
MAKPKSENKRNAILSAASQVFAERGLVLRPRDLDDNVRDLLAEAAGS